MGKIDTPWDGPLTVAYRMISGHNALVVESQAGRKLVIR
jgi:hypothetical protein